METVHKTSQASTVLLPNFDIESLVQPGCELGGYHRQLLLNAGIAANTSVQSSRRIQLHRLSIAVFGWVGVGLAILSWHL